MKDSLPGLLPGAEPRFFRGGALGCLVVHGFMASPAEVGWLGDYLAQQGHTVYVPRVTGHGINPRHMRRMRWKDWYAQVLDGYYLLRQQCEKVVVIGHSMGGLLVGLLASAYPVDALVIAAAPVVPPGGLVPYSKLIDPVVPYTEHPSEPELNAVIEAEQRRRGEPIYSRVHYPRWSTRAVYEMHKLISLVPDHLAGIQAPLLLLYAAQDRTAPPEHAEKIAACVASGTIEQYVLKEGAHIIFQDVGREEAFRVVGDFVQRYTQGN